MTTEKTQGRYSKNIVTNSYHDFPNLLEALMAVARGELSLENVNSINHHFVPCSLSSEFGDQPGSRKSKLFIYDVNKQQFLPVTVAADTQWFKPKFYTFETDEGSSQQIEAFLKIVDSWLARIISEVKKHPDHLSEDERITLVTCAVIQNLRTSLGLQQIKAQRHFSTQKTKYSGQTKPSKPVTDLSNLSKEMQYIVGGEFLAQELGEGSDVLALISMSIPLSYLLMRCSKVSLVPSPMGKFFISDTPISMTKGQVRAPWEGASWAQSEQFFPLTPYYCARFTPQGFDIHYRYILHELPVLPFGGLRKYTKSTQDLINKHTWGWASRSVGHHNREIIEEFLIANGRKNLPTPQVTKTMYHFPLSEVGGTRTSKLPGYPRLIPQKYWDEAQLYDNTIPIDARREDYDYCLDKPPSWW